MEKLQISLAAARVNAGMTQADVAGKMHLNKQTIVNWENNRVIPTPASRCGENLQNEKYSIRQYFFAY